MLKAYVLLVYPMRRSCFKSASQMAIGIKIRQHQPLRFMSNWQRDIG
jgi:hypothetical protein